MEVYYLVVVDEGKISQSEIWPIDCHIIHHNFIPQLLYQSNYFYVHHTMSQPETQFQHIIIITQSNLKKVSLCDRF